MELTGLVHIDVEAVFQYWYIFFKYLSVWSEPKFTTVLIFVQQDIDVYR